MILLRSDIFAGLVMCACAFVGGSYLILAW